MLKVVLIDDEMPALSELAYIIEESGTAEVIGKFTDSVEGLLFIQNHHPDAVFLDINMPQMDGMKLAEAIGGLGTGAMIIFATAYEEHALEAFNQDATDYLLKPYEEARVYKALSKVEESISKRTNGQTGNQPLLKKLPISQEDRIIFINVEDILFCNVEENKVYIHTAEKTYSMTESLTNIEEKLSGETFFKTHRAYIVNLEKVSEVSPYFNHTLIVQVEGSKEQIPVSRSNVKAFKKRLKI